MCVFEVCIACLSHIIVLCAGFTLYTALCVLNDESNVTYLLLING